MERISQSIMIVDKSNRVVGTGKQLKGVFLEAKNAYLERRAEIKAKRARRDGRDLEDEVEEDTIAEDEEPASRAGSPRALEPSQTNESRRTRRNSDEASRYSHVETNTASRYSHSPRLRNDLSSPRSQQSSRSRIDTAQVAQSRSAPVSPADGTESLQMIRRSKTELELTSKPKLTRSRSTPDVDLDLAYGDFHAGDLKALTPTSLQELSPEAQKDELGTLVRKCQDILDEANCVQHSVRSMVTHLQENPEAMAAVALTLAEISNLASKMAPGALTAFKASAPAVLALLASPQFLIAVGVGIGVTVVMFGGYKIVKKIKAHRHAARSKDALAYGPDGGNMDEALDVQELDRIEKWRRGIADTQLDDDGRTVASGYSASSMTTVEGEIITPFAAQSMGHLPLRRNKDKKAKKAKKEEEKKDKKDKKKSSSKPRDVDADQVDAPGSKSPKSATPSSRDRQVVKVKKPSQLRKMFASGSSVKSSR